MKKKSTFYLWCVHKLGFRLSICMFHWVTYS